MKLATTKLVLLEVPNPKLPHLMSLTPLLSTRKITQQCLPGKFEIGYLVKAYALMIMCPALVRLTGKLTQIRFLGRFRVWVGFGFSKLIAMLQIKLSFLRAYGTLIDSQMRNSN